MTENEQIIEVMRSQLQTENTNYENNPTLYLEGRAAGAEAVWTAVLQYLGLA